MHGPYSMMYPKGWSRWQENILPVNWKKKHLILESSLEMSESKITIYSPFFLQVFTQLKALLGGLDSDRLAEKGWGVVTDSLQVKKKKKQPGISLFLNFHSVCIEKHSHQFWPSTGKEYSRHQNVERLKLERRKNLYWLSIWGHSEEITSCKTEAVASLRTSEIQAR